MGIAGSIAPVRFCYLLCPFPYLPGYYSWHFLFNDGALASFADVPDTGVGLILDNAENPGIVPMVLVLDFLGGKASTGSLSRDFLSIKLGSYLPATQPILGVFPEYPAYQFRLSDFNLPLGTLITLYPSGALPPVQYPSLAFRRLPSVVRITRESRS